MLYHVKKKGFPLQMAIPTTQNLSAGRVPTQLLAFSWPLVLTNFLQILHGVTDLLLTGRFLGKTAMSAVTIGGQSVLFLTTFSLGLAAGGQILVAQLHGAKKPKEQSGATTSLFLLSLLIGLCVALLGFFLAPLALRFLQTPEDALEGALHYMQITSLGLLFTFLYNAIAGSLRGRGDSRRPLLFSAVSTALHIALGFLFLGRWSWGIPGLALAFVIAQGSAVLLGAVSLFQTRHEFGFSLHPKTLLSSYKTLGQILKIGVPFGLQMGLLNLSNLFITRLVNPFGIAASAALGAGSRITNLLTVPMMAIGNGASTMIGQSLGAEKPRRAAATVRWALIYTLLFVSLTTSLTLLFPAALLRLFTTETEVIQIGTIYLTTLVWGYAGHALHTSFNAPILGSGMTGRSLFAAGAEALIGRVALTWLFSSLWMLPGIFIAQAIAPYLAATLSLTFFFSGRWKKHLIES